MDASATGHHFMFYGTTITPPVVQGSPAQDSNHLGYFEEDDDEDDEDHDSYFSQYNRRRDGNGDDEDDDYEDDDYYRSSLRDVDGDHDSHAPSHSYKGYYDEDGDDAHYNSYDKKGPSSNSAINYISSKYYSTYSPDDFMNGSGGNTSGEFDAEWDVESGSGGNTSGEFDAKWDAVVGSPGAATDFNPFAFATDNGDSFPDEAEKSFGDFSAPAFGGEGVDPFGTTQVISSTGSSKDFDANDPFASTSGVSSNADFDPFGVSADVNAKKSEVLDNKTQDPFGDFGVFK
jgi:hypothetical protein